jgi:uncharacterized repeat protein (TIGR03803 family)
MMNRNVLCLLVASVAIAAAAFGPATARAQTETALYSFKGGSDGAEPEGALIGDSKGNAYGTTAGGGNSNCFSGCGVVFKVSRHGETILHTFTGAPNDGDSPRGTLLRDKSGNLYGTTDEGGANDTGTVFKITPSGTESILWSFGPPGSGDGAGPSGALARDAEGNLYGMSVGGGAFNLGTVFEITATGMELVLYSFQGETDGALPLDGPILYQTGNLYGTTSAGGNGYGTVFEFSTSGKETVLHRFQGAPTDGDFPTSSLVFDRRGNLLGTTRFGGTQKNGTVFALNPASGYEKLLYSFGSQAGDGISPFAGVTIASKGNLYGTTTNGGAGNAGTVYSLAPGGAETVVYEFGAKGDGINPYGGLLLDVEGNLHGTTLTGGKHGQGTIFRITP